NLSSLHAWANSLNVHIFLIPFFEPVYSDNYSLTLIHESLKLVGAFLNLSVDKAGFDSLPRASKLLDSFDEICDFGFDRSCQGFQIVTSPYWIRRATHTRFIP